MNAQVLALKHTYPKVGRDLRRVGAPSTDIAFSVRIDADPDRVMRAITVPEFLEAWISHPECRRGCMVRASRIACSYRIDFVYNEILESSISGVFRMSQNDKLLMTWRRFGVCEEAQSLVNILLQGDEGSSQLELRHVGLPSRAEYEWHEQLWRASLHNLTQLFRSRLSLAL